MAAADRRVFVNGRLLRRRSARIDYQDRGFRYGDGVFETIRVAGSRPYRLGYHLSRLTASLDMLGIPAPRWDIGTTVIDLIHRNRQQRGTVRVWVTRGLGGRGFRPPVDPRSTLIVATDSHAHRPVAPVRLWVSQHAWPVPVALATGGKLLAGLAGTLAQREAALNGCDETLLLDSDDSIREGAASNIFWVRDDTLYTPGRECAIVLGTIRDRIIALTNLVVREARYGLTELEGADEVFITNTGVLVASVVEVAPLDYHFEPGPVATMLRALIEADGAAG